MKKIYIVMAVLATAALASCQQEESFEEGKKVEENDVVFAIKSVATRSSEIAPAARRGAVIPIEGENSGVKLYLEETVENLGALAAEPETKGTPVYTENLGKMYGSMVVYAAGDFGTATFDKMEDTMYDGGWRYNHTYDENPWADDNPVDFYMRMPATQAGVTSGYDYGKTGTQQTITFSYLSPATAAAQEDILFAARPISRADHVASLPGGVPVLFDHALTAVKFAIANPDEATITSITFKGLYDGGKCVISPASESDYRDVKDNYSSATAAVWSTLTKSGRDIASGTYDNPIEYSTTGSFGNKGNYPESFAKTGNKNNLNKADGSQTFWLVPQTVPQDLKLTITYTYKGDPGTATIKFGEALRMKGGDLNTVWKAGELRTYTLKVDDINVKIEDTVTVPTTANADNGYTGSYKSGVAITNTSNTDAYIRAALIGQWHDADGNPVFGYTDFTAQDIKLVESWYDDQFGAGDGSQGTFVGLAGYKGAGSVVNKWEYNPADGHYYYTEPVAPGKILGIAPDDAENKDDYIGNPLFTSYTVETAPIVTVAGEVKLVYFSLEIATQAIPANKMDGSHYATWREAWALAK